MRILILTDSYPPEVRSAAQLMYDLASGLSSLGHDVTVATSCPEYNLAGDAEYCERDRREGGVRVLRIKTLPHHKVNFIVRGLAQLALPWIFLRSIKKSVREKTDVIYLHSPPLPLYSAGWRLKKKWNAKFILNVHDIFPQNAVDLGIMNNKLLVKFFERMERGAYKKNDSIITPSEAHKKFLVEQRGVFPAKVRVVEHWIDLPSFRGVRTGAFRKRFNLAGKFVFVFGGVMGPSQGLDVFIRAAGTLSTIPEIHFLFVGDGTEKSRLEDTAREKKLKNISFEHFISPEEYPNMLSDMDVALLSLTNKNTTPAVPAKLMGYMAAGMPVVGLVHKESEAIRIIREAKCGYAAEYGSDAVAVELIEKMYREKNKLAEYSRNAKTYAALHFDKSVAIAKIAKIMESL